MSAYEPTVDDLRVIAHNLQAEGHNSRAQVVYGAARVQEILLFQLGVKDAEVRRVDATNTELRAENAELKRRLAVATSATSEGAEELE